MSNQPLHLPIVAAPKPSLPCHPCPHASACCSWGVSLTDAEAEELRRLYGDRVLVRDEEENEWRTSVSGDAGCVFLSDNACRLHDRPEYPRMCRGFPYTDGAGGEYIWDRSICPEFEEELE
jgi:Fe-S-cluster containining protein